MPDKNRTDLQSIHKNIQEILRKLESFQTETRRDFANMDTRITSMDDRIARITQHVAHIPQIEMRLQDLESEMTAVRVRLDNLDGLYQHLDKKLEILDHE